MKCLTFVLAAAALLAQPQKPRGQTGPPDRSQSWTRGRLGTQAPLPGGVVTLHGILIDASCEDRTALNLNRPPEVAVAKPAERPVPAESARGHEHKGSAGSADRAAPAEAPETHEHEGLLHTSTGMDDYSCAITRGTRGYALFTAEGRLLNLDEGGNTLVLQSLHDNAAGRAMLNGEAGGLKPNATLRGRIQGDRLIVEKVVKL